MPKKFVVRLRKGGVAGNIVANSQVITINSLTDGPIFPSNFEDGRLVGRILTTDRAANFIKSIIPRPTTTTTTTRAPVQTTTTRAPLLPGQTSTTTTFSPSNVPSSLCNSINFQLLSDGKDTGLLVLYDPLTPSLTTASIGVRFNFTNPILGNGEYEVDISDYRISKNSNGQVRFNSKLTATLNDRGTNNFGNAAWAGSTGDETLPGPYRYKLELFLKERPGRPRTLICEINKELTVVIPTPPVIEISKITPIKVAPGGSMDVTISYKMVPADTEIYLYILQGQGAGAASDGKVRPATTDIVSPKFFAGGANSILAFVPLTASLGPATKIVTIKFDNSLPWLTGDFQEWNFALAKDLYGKEIYFTWGNRDPLQRPILTRQASNLKLSVVMNSAGSTTQDLAYPGETVYINLDGLSSGTKYSLILRHEWEYADDYGGTSLNGVRTFDKSWFNTNYLTTDGLDGWMIGGTFSGSKFPPKTPVSNPFSYNITAYYYPFVASGATKTITLPIQSNIPVRFVSSPVTELIRVGDKRFDAASKYKFEVKLMDGDGISYLGVNYGAPFGSVTKSLDYFNLKDSRPIFHTNLEYLEKRTLTTSQSIRLEITAGDAITATELGSSGYRIVGCFFGENGNVTSNSFKFSQGTQFASSPTYPHNSSFPGSQNFYYDITSPMPKGFTIYVTIELNPTGTYSAGNFGFIMYGYRVQDPPNFSSDYNKIADYRNHFKIEGGVAPVTISNVKFTPANGILNETPNNNLLSIDLDITAAEVRTVYWRCVGPNITPDDFDGGSSGNFDTKIGTENVKGATVRIRPDAATEGDEVFSIAFYLSNSTTAQPFYTIPTQFTIRDTSTTINELVKLADSALPPYHNNVPLPFVVTDGVRNSQFDIIANGNILMSPFLEDNGSWAGYCDFTGTPAGDLTITFKFKATEHTRTVTITFVGPKGGSSFGPGTGCPDPDMLINISPDSYVRAGSLQVGDIIWTMHEKTLEYGYFSVTSVEEVKQPKIKITFDNDRDVTVSLSHRFLSDDNQYVWARDLREGSWVQARDGRFSVVKLAKADVGPVIRLEIERAHTYIVNGFISHNVKGDDRKSMDLM